MDIFPQKIQLARDIIDQFIKDWKKDPYYYDNEFSIQAEIYMRIKKCLELLGQQIVPAFYGDSWVQDGYKDKQNWCRVSAEPYFYLDEKKIDHCHPDIVIWDDKPGVKEHTWYTTENWPALWICEIKVNSKINTVKSKNSNWDIKKMEQLIKSNDVHMAVG